MVNEEGKRFGNEAKGYSEFAVEVLQQPNQHGVIVFDQGIYDELLSHEDFKMLNEMNAFKTGDSIGVLARELGVNETTLKETFDAFQQNKDGVADAFNRTYFPKRLNGPFYGIKVSPALFHTQGGLKINTNAQVLNEQEEIIENLYAGGGAAVGVSGNHAYGYMSGNGLLAAFGLGKIAGEHAAKTIKEETI